MLMSLPSTNRFQDFFEEDRYVLLKNHLYNYLLRKRAVQKNLQQTTAEMVLEVGSGISPMIMDTDGIVYTELSPLALQILKRHHGRGGYVAADGLHLPFKSSAFTHAVCSEVLEHLQDDRSALQEMARVLKSSGRLIVTFPHRKAYFAKDDRFVEHYRRYDLQDMMTLLEQAGLKPISVQKVLGPLEKITMVLTVWFISLIPKSNRSAMVSHSRFLEFFFRWANNCYACIARLEARIVPLSLATVLLVKAIKK
jgi:SAM-dependent methyltransferase